MTIRRPRRTEQLRDVPGLLDAMGRCRKVVLDAQDSVKPFGVMFHGCGMVTAAIDALAYLVSGQPHYYSLSGSMPARSDRLDPWGRPHGAPDPISPAPAPTPPERPAPAAPEPTGD